MSTCFERSRACSFVWLNTESTCVRRESSFLPIVANQSRWEKYGVLEARIGELRVAKGKWHSPLSSRHDPAPRLRATACNQGGGEVMPVTLLHV